MLKKAAAYVRYSSDNQREESIEAQLKYINDFAKQNGYEIVKAYADEAKSATTDKRPMFQEMMKDAPKGLFDFVIVHKLDRFSRDRYDFAYYKRYLKKHGIRLISVLENIDDSPESIMMESVLEGMAEYYSRNLAREVMRKGMIPNAQKCKHNGGVPPLGYDVDAEGHYVINEKEAEAVRYIFKAYLENKGYAHICEWLKEHDIKSKYGRYIAKNSIHDILTNEKYTGVYIYNRATSKDAEGHRNNRRSKPEDEIIRIEGGMPAIISKEIYEKAMMKMSKNRSGTNRAKEPYLLSGIIFCGKCGGAMVGSSRGVHKDKNEKQQRYYECNFKKRAHACDMRAIKRDDIESAVIQYLESLVNKDTIDDITEWLNEHTKIYLKTVRSELKTLKSEVAALTRNINTLLDKILSGLDSETARARLKEMEDKKFSLELRITELTNASETGITPSKQLIKKYLSQLEGLHEKDRFEQAAIINQFVNKVIIHEYDPENPERKFTVKTNLDLVFMKLEDRNGGGDGSRTRVRKFLADTFYERSSSFAFPRVSAEEQADMLGSFISSWQAAKLTPAHVHY